MLYGIIVLICFNSYLAFQELLSHPVSKFYILLKPFMTATSGLFRKWGRSSKQERKAIWPSSPSMSAAIGLLRPTECILILPPTSWDKKQDALLLRGMKLFLPSLSIACLPASSSFEKRLGPPLHISFGRGHNLGAARRRKGRGGGGEGGFEAGPSLHCPSLVADQVTFRRV